MSGQIPYAVGKRCILKTTVTVDGVPPFVFRLQATHLVHQEIAVAAGTDAVVMLANPGPGTYYFVAFNSDVEGVEVGFSQNDSAPTTSSTTSHDIILRPFAVISDVSMMWQAGTWTYPAIIVRNGTAYDARVTIIFGAN